MAASTDDFSSSESTFSLALTAYAFNRVSVIDMLFFISATAKGLVARTTFSNHSHFASLPLISLNSVMLSTALYVLTFLRLYLF